MHCHGGGVQKRDHGLRCLWLSKSSRARRIFQRYRPNPLRSRTLDCRARWCPWCSGAVLRGSEPAVSRLVRCGVAGVLDQSGECLAARWCSQAHIASLSRVPEGGSLRLLLFSCLAESAATCLFCPIARRSELPQPSDRHVQVLPCWCVSC